MWIRKRLDISWSDLAAGILGCCRMPVRTTLQRRVEQRWSSQTLVCLSVRSGLDLLLETLHWPVGSEVLISALTIPDMPRIIQHHGLVPAPVDLDAATLGPNLLSLRQAITRSSRAILVAHLMGGRLDMGPVLQLAREHGLFVIEDCAQAFDGTDYRGHPGADVSMFSFGTIKTATALGGACLQIRDSNLRREMQTRQARHPVQRRVAFLWRLLKYAVLKGLSTRLACALLVRLANVLGRDYDQAINHLARGFAGDDFFGRIRQLPSAPLLILLERRLRTYDANRVRRRAFVGRLLESRLAERYVCPGAAMQPHNFWVFPVLVDNPQAAIAALRDAGFDATQGHSMCVVQPPADRPELAAQTAQEILARTVYLPLYPELSESALLKLGDMVSANATGTRGFRGDRS
jgi:dTDP-4-amino-4,6-dideoxygalactose transaminase